MDPPSFHVDFAQVDRVEVAKGPFDVKNQGSLGGVVNIVTRRPEPGLHATANAAAGVVGLRQPVDLGLVGRRVVLGPRRVLLPAVGRRSRTATAAVSPS